MRATTLNPIFVYYFPDTQNFKVYRPLTKDKDKWLSNTTGNDVYGANTLPFTGDRLFITSSLKDVMCLYEMGYTAIAPQSETTKLTVPYVDSLKQTFKEVLVFFDTDGEFNPPKSRPGKGKEAANNASKRYGVDMVFTNDDKCKDISDYYQKYGKAKAKKLMDKLEAMKYQD